MSYTYHGTVHGLRTGLSIQQPTASFAVTNAYDAARRLTNVATSAGSHSYLYAGGGTYATHLIRRLTHPNTSYITNDYDSVARMLFTKLNNSLHTTLNSHSYTYNVGNQRTRQTRRDSSYVDYTYDSVGQLTRALGSGGYSTENLGYGYDVAWNLSVRTNNGTPTTFTVNVLDQLTAGPAPSYTYDWNGNLTSEQNARAFTYDDENQLTSVTHGTYYQSTFEYDGRGRLRRLRDYTYGQYGWQVSSETRYIYDGMLIVQERSSSNVPTVTYTRGTDLSGTFEGAGGIGGLLTGSDQYNSGTGGWGRHVFYHADGNGNVTYTVDTSQTKAGEWRYDPYGRSLYSSTPVPNSMRFSSKLYHSNSGFYYYGYRFYDPNLQRWLNRDPIFEASGVNLYAYVGNYPTVRVDPVGLFERSGSTFTVGDCEILIVYGHASSDTPFCFKFTSTRCAAGVATCFLDKQIQTIPEPYRIPGQLPGGFRCWWGKKTNWQKDLIAKAAEAGSYDHIDGDAALDALLEGASSKLSDLCKCCDAVTISVARNGDPDARSDKDQPSMKHNWMKINCRQPEIKVKE